MGIVVLKNLILEKELEQVKEEYGDYVKLVVDIHEGLLAAGGEWHADAERVLLDINSQQKNIWGGGIDLQTGEVDYISLINTRPNYNNSQEVSDIKIRQEMLKIIKKVFANYVKE